MKYEVQLLIGEKWTTVWKTEHLQEAEAVHDDYVEYRDVEPYRARIVHPVEPKPKYTPYVSIDIETTGIDPDTCQVLEVAAVIEDWVTPVDKLPYFRTAIHHDTIVGEPFALSMHSALLKEIASDDSEALSPCQLVGEFLSFLSEHDIRQPINCAGKNFGAFDRVFLKKLPGFDKIRLRHRYIDPAMLYWDINDTHLPDTKTCMTRAGIGGIVAHTALEDARQTIRLIREQMLGL